MNRSREGKDDEVFSAEQAAAFQTNNARVLSIFMERYLLKFHWSTRVEDTSVVGLEGRGLLRRKYFVIFPSLDLFIGDAQGSFELLIGVEIPTLPVFQENQIGAVFEKRL